MKTKFNGFITLILVLVVQFSFAQERSISGKVTDDLGAVADISVLVKGSTEGAVTDFDGNYTIKAKTGDVLVFSHISYENIEKTVGASNTLDIKLSSNGNLLDEIVVTGVATATSRKKVGVAVNAVRGSTLKEAAGAMSIDQALQGKIAGTVIQSTSGQPGQQQDIVLRSITSLNSSQPMILIDGIEILSSSNSIGGTSNLSSRLSDIDFSNIERVETISGAAAGTIYGAQGANGVINLISKKGKLGKAKVTINSSVAISSAITNDEMRRANLHHYQTNASGFLIDLNGDPVIQLDGQSSYLAVVPLAVNVNGTDLGAAGINNTPYAEQTFDATDVLFSNASNISYGATVSGASDKINYLFSGNRNEQESVIIDGKYVKYNAKMNLGFDVSDKIKIFTRFDVINSQNDTGTNTDNANSNNLINNVFQNLPHVDLSLLNSDGELTVQPDNTDPNSSNPFFYRNIQTRLDEVTRYMSNFNIIYNPFDVLSLNLKYGYDTYSEDFTFFQENQSDHLQAVQIGSDPNGRINFIQTQEFFQNFLATANLNLNFNEKFGWNTQLTTNTTLTFDWRDRKFEQSSISGTGLPFGQFGDFNLQQAGDKNVNYFFESLFRTYGILVMQKFDFGSLFGFTAGFRTDYSNRFGDSQTFTFPRADVYFNIADVWKNDKVKTLKLRAAYGEAGNQPPFGSNLITLRGLDGSGITFNDPIGNTSLKVERTDELEIGFDYVITPTDGQWLSRLNGSLNYFDRNTTDAIYISELPPSSGSAQVWDNAYGLESDGLEFSIDSKIYKSDKFNWNFGIRYSNSKTILSDIKSGLPFVVGDNFVLQEGQEIGTFSTFEVVTSLTQTDLDGNLIIPTTDVNNFTVASSGYVVNKNSGNVVITPDKRVVGSSQPDFVMTFTNGFSYNDFISLNVQIDWFQGLDKYNNSKQWLYNNGIHADTAVPVTIEDPTGANQTGAFVGYYTSLYNTNVPLDHFVEDASFVRFRDISLNFKLDKILKNIDFIESMNVRLSGRNLITITDYTGLDPEASRNAGNTFQRGFDEFTHPNTKSYNLNLSITF